VPTMTPVESTPVRGSSPDPTGAATKSGSSAVVVGRLGSGAEVMGLAGVSVVGTTTVVGGSSVVGGAVVGGAVVEGTVVEVVVGASVVVVVSGTVVEVEVVVGGVAHTQRPL
jgi:hypothetical protein